MWSPVVLNGEFTVHLNGDSSPSLSNTLTLDKNAVDLYNSLINNSFCYSGICVLGLLDENVTQGDFISKTSSGWQKGSTDSSSSYKAIHGVALQTDTSGNSILILLYGSVTNSVWSGISGQLCYADNETLTNTPSSTFIQVIGKKILSPEDTNDNTMLFDPDYKYTIGGA